MPPLNYIMPYKVSGPTYSYPNASHLLIFDGVNGSTGPFNNYGSTGSLVEPNGGTVYIRSTPARTTNNMVGDLLAGGLTIGKGTPEALLGTMDFTIQLWVRIPTKSGTGILPITGSNDASTGWFLNVGATGYNDSVTFGPANNGQGAHWGGWIGFGANNTAFVMPTNTWVHFSICRQGTKLYTHRNGSWMQTITIDANQSMNPIGAQVSTIKLNSGCYLEDVYINRGVAEWQPNTNYGTPTSRG